MKPRETVSKTMTPIDRDWAGFVEWDKQRGKEHCPYCNGTGRAVVADGPDDIDYVDCSCREDE